MGHLVVGKEDVLGVFLLLDGFGWVVGLGWLVLRGSY